LRLLISFVAVLVAGAAMSSAEWAFEVHGGAPHGMDRTVHIDMEMDEDIELDASMKSRPFTSPYYYDLRLIRWSDDGATGWALDLLHHKLILEEPTDEVQVFQLTHGYNLLTVQRLWRKGATILMAGAGVVIAHPENTIHGRSYQENEGIFGWGYLPSGPVVIAGAGRQLKLTSRFYLVGDVRASLSHVDVPVVGGRATMTDVSLHFLGGAGFLF